LWCTRSVYSWLWTGGGRINDHDHGLPADEVRDADTGKPRELQPWIEELAVERMRRGDERDPVSFTVLPDGSIVYGPDAEGLPPDDDEQDPEVVFVER
jgi:hypothetical protein